MYRLNYKGADIVVISEMVDFFEWYLEQDAQTKILVAGNHDAEFAKGIAAFSELVPEGIALLDNCKAAIRCIKDGADEITLATVPVRLKGIGKEWIDLEDVDILLTHCPPRGILDGKNHYGSRRLAEHIANYKPKFHLFGHVHLNEPRVMEVDGITYVNVTRKIL